MKKIKWRFIPYSGGQKKPFKLVFDMCVAIILPLVMSCAPSSGGGDFTINTNNQNLLIFLDTTTVSCAAISAGSSTADVTAVYFNLNKINFKWAKYTTNPLTIHWVNFKVQATGVTFTTTLGGESLLYSFYGTDATTGYLQDRGPYDAIIYTGDVVVNNTSVTWLTAHPNVAAATSSNNCPFRIGGIGISNKKNDLYGNVLITAYATYENAGQTTPITAQTTVEFFFKGSGI